MRLKRWLAKIAVTTTTLTGLVTAAMGISTQAAQAAAPAGDWGPSDLQSAYQLPTSLNPGVTVAVVAPYNDAPAATDLDAYRSNYGLSSCTATGNCFSEFDETGTAITSTNHPTSEPSPATAMSLDAISAVCPSCHLMLVEAASTDMTHIGKAVAEAVKLGAKVVTVAYRIDETSLADPIAGTNETQYDQYFNQRGIAITAPDGDSGYGSVSYPAASPYVIAVGGTTLTHTASGARSWTETVTPGTGSGCSEYEPKPSWQTDTYCTGRTLNDTAAVDTGVAYYDTSGGTGGWETSTGNSTAESAAIVAGIYALGGAPAPGSYPASYLYDHPGGLWKVTGSDGGPCVPTQLCTAGGGYTGPAGMGVANGDTSFNSPGAKPASVTDLSGNTWAFATTTDGEIKYAMMAQQPPGVAQTGWTAWTSLGLPSQGGTFSGYPGALATSNSTIYVFALDGGVLYDDSLASGSTTWSGWNQIGGSDWAGTPTVIQDKSGTIHVFVRNINSGNVYENRLTSGATTWSGFTDLGHTMPNDIAAGVGGGGTIKLEGVANNSELYEDTLAPTAGAAWSGWKRITPVSATVTGTPALQQDANGIWHVFVREYNNGALLEDTQASGTTTWNADTSLGGTWTHNPSAQVTGDGCVYLNIIGNAGNLYYDDYTTTAPGVDGSGSAGWQGWAEGAAGYSGTVGSSTWWDGPTTYLNTVNYATTGAISVAQGSEIYDAGGEGTPTSLGGSFAGS